ncbi:MAG: NADH-quinone oxidoreductase subunit J [Pseudomonadales bacterium]
MNGEVILFYVLAGGALAGGVSVIRQRNPMYSALSLLVTFLAVAGLFFLQHAEFLGVVQVFVYGGGIMVLFLFVIMLVNLQALREVQLFLGQTRWVFLVVGGLALVLAISFMGVEFGPAFTDPDVFRIADGELRGNSEAVAWTLYTEYLLPFEIASIFLLVAMLGAVILGRKD